MNNSNYNLFKTIKKTEQNNENLQLIEAKMYSNFLIDLTHLNNYKLPIEVLENIKTECKHLSAANTTMFCGKCDTFQAYDGILKFQCMRVFKDNGCKHCYNIFVLQSINRLNYGERSSVYNKMFDENMINIAEDHIFERTIDIELE